MVSHFKGETGNLDCQYRILGTGGDYRWVQDHGIGVRDESGSVIRLVGAVRDITRSVMFLIADEADWITGSTLTVNGGQNML